MSKHTPGPWVVHSHKAYVVPAEHADRRIGGHRDKDIDLQEFAQEICALHWPDRHRNEDEVKANAQLISAAPELLDALKMAYEDIPGWVGLARKAIEKAEGK
jgi:hypothetical protein